MADSWPHANTATAGFYVSGLAITVPKWPAPSWYLLDAMAKHIKLVFFPGQHSVAILAPVRPLGMLQACPVLLLINQELPTPWTLFPAPRRTSCSQSAGCWLTGSLLSCRVCETAGWPGLMLLLSCSNTDFKALSLTVPAKGCRSHLSDAPLSSKSHPSGMQLQALLQVPSFWFLSKKCNRLTSYHESPVTLCDVRCVLQLRGTASECSHRAFLQLPEGLWRLVSFLFLFFLNEKERPTTLICWFRSNLDLLLIPKQILYKLISN